MASKRPLEPAGPGGDAKRIRANNGSPTPAPASANTNGESEAERKKRETAERMAAIKAKLAASNPNGASTEGVDANQRIQKQIAEMKARFASQKGQTGRTGSPVNGALGSTAQLQSEREAGTAIAEARARAAELSKQKNIVPPSTPTPPPPKQEGARGARGGLAVALHPTLMGEGSAPSAASKSKGPKFSTTKGNQQPAAPKTNPYLPADDEAEQRPEQHDDSTFDPSLSTRKSAGERKSKQLVFNQKGKFMAQANALRQQARLEEMKSRIAAETRKIEIEEASDKAFLVPLPPEVEWWDEGLLPENQNSYEHCLEEGRNKISTTDSIITALIQHPVMLAPPQDKFAPAPKALMLTAHEQKKLRRQRRMADMKEEQAKIRLGLVEPPPPKVKKSNMMRVLGEQAVKDPTAVEARVNREIAQRAADHERANEDRKLTKEQRLEKLKTQQGKDEAKGVRVAVFRVDNLSSGKHRYQIDINAKQNAVTGIVVLHPTMNLIIVEGGAKSINDYQKLMLNRIKWAENTLPLENTNPRTFTGTSSRTDNAADRSAEGGGGGNKAAMWCSPLDENGELKDLSENRCLLVWEGEEQARVFKKWGSRACETDGEARDVLSRHKMENMWTLARSMSVA